MNVRNYIFGLIFLLAPVSLMAQYNPFTGTWQMATTGDSIIPSVHIEMQVAYPEKNVLFPARIILQCNNFYAIYNLLLVKKSSRELAISKNKFAVTERPFHLGANLFMLNGIFDLSRNFKGVSMLGIHRIQTGQVTAMPDSLLTDVKEKITASSLLGFLKDADISMFKVNDKPWKSDDADRILSPSLSPVYFGIKDTVTVLVRDGGSTLSTLKKNDIATVSLNGNTFIDKQLLNKKPYNQDIVLDSGKNLVVLFADNFSEGQPNKGKLALTIGRSKINLDFTSKEDSAASFIIANVYCDRDRYKNVHFKEYTSAYTEPLQPNEKLVGGIVVNSQQLKFAVWDDEVEDGDSISISINGKWITRGFPVKKVPQFITVTVKPGANVINFVADNLGSIPPNTSVLEIIEGAKRQSYMLQTMIGENNLVKILYDVK